MDLQYIYMIINIIWEIFSILFVLYKYTTFFNVLYNFTQFVLRIFTTVYGYIEWCIYYIRDNNTTINTFFSNFKEYFKRNRDENVIITESLLEENDNINDSRYEDSRYNVRESDNMSNMNFFDSYA